MESRLLGRRGRPGARCQKWLNSVDGGIWYYALGGSGFLVSDFDNVGCTQSYELTEFGTKARVDLEFGGGEYRVEVYEGSLTTPAWTRSFSSAGGDQGIGNVCTGVLPGHAQGDEFGACYQDRTCNSGLTCAMGKSCDAVGLATCCMFVDEPGPVGSGGPLPIPPEEGCASDGSCQPGFACVQGPICDDLVNCCVEAGDVGQPCLAGGTCSEDLVCSDDPSSAIPKLGSVAYRVRVNLGHRFTTGERRPLQTTRALRSTVAKKREIDGFGAPAMRRIQTAAEKLLSNGPGC